MLIKFTSGGRGGGGEVAAYLTSPDRAGRDHAPPEVVRGDMDRTRDLIDSIDRQWSYTHGVLSFAVEDAPTEDQQREAMDAFERLAFAGMDPEQYDITWVRHQHTEGRRVELHFVTPRMELSTGKALNVAPPGWERSYAPLRDMLNWTHGWARPDDPARATEHQRAPERAADGFRLRAGRDGIHAYLTELVAAERVTDRASMVAALHEAGLQTPRQGKDYLTVQDPESGEKYRMKGRIYEKGWTYDRELDRAAAKEAVQPDGRDRGVGLGRAEAARGELEAAIGKRAAHHADRYPRREPEHDQGIADIAPDRALVVDRLGRDMDDGGGLLSLAFDASRRTGDRTVPDLHRERSDDPASAGRDRSDDMSQDRDHGPASVRSPADEGLTDGPAHRVRARLAHTVRDIGDRLRHLAGSVRDHVQEASRAVLQLQIEARRNFKETGRARELTVAFDRSLGRADESCRGVAERGRALGDAGERAGGRAAALIAERQERDRVAAQARRRERSRKNDYGL
jgi:hypothetical protein